jgi:hypothetical protein
MRIAPILAVAAFAGGLIVGAGPDAPGATRFLEAWGSGDYEAMHAELTASTREKYPLEQFRGAYERAMATATVESLDAGEVTDEGDLATAPIQFETHVFGTLDGDLELPISDGQIDWSPQLVFPGLTAEL